jgi:hypothetical protein
MEKQIELLEKIIVKGKVKNKYALNNKIKTLKKKAYKESKIKNWNNFLSQ